MEVAVSATQLIYKMVEIYIYISFSATPSPHPSQTNNRFSMTGWLAIAITASSMSGNDTWMRDSGWRPSLVEQVVNGLPEIIWPGQNAQCTSMYGEFLQDYHSSYYAGCGYVDDVLSLPTTVTFKEDYSTIESSPTLEGCIRSCFSKAPFSWDQPSFHPLESLPGIKPIEANTPEDTTPYQSVNVIWTQAFNSCRCDTDFSKKNNTLRVDDGWGLGDCNHKVYTLPLGCLFTAEAGCSAAPRDSCLWTANENPCCLDSKGYAWKRKAALAWKWAAGSFLLIMALFSWGIVLQCSNSRRVSRRVNDNSLETELIESHKQRYEVFLQKLIINITPEDTISQCSICLSDLTEQRCGQFPCGHKLHFSCMTDYVMYQIGKSQKKYPECPVCRQRVYDDLDDKDESDEDRQTGLEIAAPEPPVEIAAPEPPVEIAAPEPPVEIADQENAIELPEIEQREEFPSPPSPSPSPSPSSSSSPSPSPDLPAPEPTDEELETLRLAE